MSRITAIAVLAVSALFAGSVLAQANPAAPGQQKKAAKSEAEQHAAWEATFKKADTNGDGGLSKDELAKTDAKAFPAIKKSFDKMDSNKDGKVTVAERDAFVAASKDKKDEKAKK
jgi:Ca2+-binding EF-hand superfamily protein